MPQTVKWTQTYGGNPREAAPFAPSSYSGIPVPRPRSAGTAAHVAWAPQHRPAPALVPDAAAWTGSYSASDHRPPPARRQQQAREAAPMGGSPARPYAHLAQQKAAVQQVAEMSKMPLSRLRQQSEATRVALEMQARLHDHTRASLVRWW